MTIQTIYTPSHQIHDDIITQLQNYAPLLQVVASNRIKAWWDNRGDIYSTGNLTPTNVMVYCQDDGEEIEAVGPSLYKFTLAITVMTAQDIPSGSSELPAPLTTPHLLHNAILGAIWYAFYNQAINQPIVNGLTSCTSNINRFIYMGRLPASTDNANYFEDTMVFDLHFYKSDFTDPFTRIIGCN